jgi:hypothetical protein
LQQKQVFCGGQVPVQGRCFDERSQFAQDGYAILTQALAKKMDLSFLFFEQT